MVLNPGIRGKVVDQFAGNKVYSSNDKGIEALKNNIYTVGAVGKQADLYTKTAKDIGDYAGRV